MNILSLLQNGVNRFQDEPIFVAGIVLATAICLGCLLLSGRQS